MSSSFFGILYLSSAKVTVLIKTEIVINYSKKEETTKAFKTNLNLYQYPFIPLGHTLIVLKLIVIFLDFSSLINSPNTSYPLHSIVFFFLVQS